MKLDKRQRDCLEMAAYAVGMELVFEEDEDGEVTVLIRERKRMQIREWNPYEDDAQALRLAVALNLEIKVLPDGVEVWAGKHGTTVGTGESKTVAVRDCIVEAAAGIGRREKAEGDAELDEEDDS